MLNKLKTNCTYIFRKAISYVTGIYAFIGFIAVFVPFDEFIPSSITLPSKIIYSVSILAGIFILSSLFVSIYVLRKNRVEIVSANNGHRLYLQYGDVFSAKVIEEPNIRRNVVIPVNRCFDTIVDNTLISETTLHGITINKLLNSGKYTLDSLDDYIHTALQKNSFEAVSIEDKPSGKLKRYPVGTVVEVPGPDNAHYFLWALSTFDSNLKARTSLVEYAVAVQRLIEACNLESEGFPVILPLVGAGLSRTKIPQSDILKYLISAFQVNRNEINCDIHVVVKAGLKNDITITDFL